jgi:3-methylcrotonyl-CoA carboxylase beta subunit
MSVLVSRVDTHGAEFQANQQAYGEMLGRLRERQAKVLGGGGAAMCQRHKDRGKILVRDRIDLLLDPLSPFLELSPLAAWDLYGGEAPGAGIVTGIGQVSGVKAMIIANDATVKGGSFFHETVRKHIRAQEIAWENGLPCIYLVDCGGAYLPEQDRVFPDWGHFGTAFHNQCRMSAEGLPQIAAVFGACTAGGAYIPALADQVIMVRGGARIHLGGPPIVRAAINEVIDSEALGGAEMHSRVSGVSDYLAESEGEALAKVRDILAAMDIALIGSPRAAHPPRHDPAEITGLVSADPKQPYDARELIARLVDDSAFEEFKAEWGESLVCGFAHLCGYPLGIIANNGVLHAESSVKGAHFISLCNQRGTPLLFLQNITGFMVGSDAERAGIAKHSAKLVYAVSTARVPRFTIIVGGSYGAGNYGMCGRGFGPRFLFAWPSARIATMSPEIATSVLTDLRLQSLGRKPASPDELRRLAEATTRQFTDQSDPFYATARLWDDGIIEPTDTREVMGLVLALAALKRPAAEAWPVYRM